MDYHLHHNGQNAGIVSLENLVRRRAAGELSGQDLVWREGMPAWAPLDSVLQQNGLPGPIGAPLLISAAAQKPRFNRPLVWAIVGVGVLMVVGATLVGIVALKFTQGYRQAAQGADRADAAEALEVAGRPIGVSANTLTEQAVRQRNRQFRVRQYVESYRQNGRHTAPWDAEARQLLDSWIAANFGGPTNLPSAQDLSDKLAAKPDCDDPLVLTAAAANAIELHEKIRRLERALAGFEGSSYPAYPRFYATVSLAHEQSGQTSRIRALDEAALRHFQRAFADGSFRPGDDEEIAEILVNGWGNDFFNRNGARVREIARQTQGDPWLALVLDGDCEVTVAWRARGSGWADSVAPQGWQGFANHLAKARTALTQAWKLYPSRPLAPARMITVAMGESGVEEMRLWFDRAVEAQIDYPLAWSNLRWGLRPRWHGSLEVLLALGNQAVETKRFDTDVPRKFFDCLSAVEAELKLPPGEHIYGRADVWPLVQRMYEGYLAEPSQASHRDGWHSAYAVAACLAGNYDVARKELEAVDWKPVRGHLTGWGADLSLMPLKVAALTGASASQVRRAESKYSQQDFSSAVKLYTELGAAPETDERTRKFSRCRLAALQQEALLARGGWIDFLPASENDPNWELWENKVRRLADGALEVESGPHGHGFYCRTRVGSEFEVTGEFELVRSSTRDFQAGLLMGLPDSPQSVWYAFRMKRNESEGAVASFSRGWTLQQAVRKITLKDGRNSFQFRLRRGTADAWVNGTQVLQQATPGKTLDLHADCLLGLGAYNDMNETVIRYRNIRVRRLSWGE